MLVDRVLKDCTHYAVTDEDQYDGIQYILDDPVVVMNYAEYWHGLKPKRNRPTTTSVYRIYQAHWVRIWQDGEWLDGLAKADYLKIKNSKPHKFKEIYKPDHPLKMDVDIGYRWKAHVIDETRDNVHMITISIDLWAPKPYHTEPTQFRVTATRSGVSPWFNDSYSCMGAAEIESVTRILKLAEEYHEYLQTLPPKGADE